jgi:hypothetical protein
MQIAPQEKAIRDFVPFHQRVRLDMGGFEDRQCAFPGYRTPARISISHQYPKQPLPQARMDDLRPPETTRFDSCGCGGSGFQKFGVTSLQPLRNALQNSLPVPISESYPLPATVFGLKSGGD